MYHEHVGLAAIAILFDREKNVVNRLSIGRGAQSYTACVFCCDLKRFGYRKRSFVLF